MKRKRSGTDKHSFKIMLLGQLSHFIDENTKAQRGQAACPGFTYRQASLKPSQVLLLFF